MTAIITPFHDDGSIDFPSFKKLIEFQINAGINGIIVCGSTGEAATLSDDEQTELIRFAVKTAEKRTIIVRMIFGYNYRIEIICCTICV